jgi:cell division septal protein FtsQ
MAKLTFQLLAFLAILFIGAIIFGLVDISPMLSQTNHASVPVEGIKIVSQYFR